MGEPTPEQVEAWIDALVARVALTMSDAESIVRAVLRAAVAVSPPTEREIEIDHIGATDEQWRGYVRAMERERPSARCVRVPGSARRSPRGVVKACGSGHRE